MLVAGKWLIVSRLRSENAEGPFVVKVHSKFVKMSNARYVDLPDWRDADAH